MIDRFERLTNLLALLLDTRRPLPLSEIVERISGYPDSKASYRRQFERDKDALRGIGVPIRTQQLGEGDVGYYVDPDEYYLPDLGLTEAESRALQLAAVSMHRGSGSYDSAVWKVGGNPESEDSLATQIPTSPHLATFVDAVRERRSLAFSYKDAVRKLEPSALALRGGNWYATGRDIDRDAPRSFRLDRVDQILDVGQPGTFEPEPDLELRLDQPAWRLGDAAPATVTVRFDPDYASLARSRASSEEAVVRADGSVDIEFSVTNWDALRSFVLEFLEHAEVLSPPSARERFIFELMPFVGDPNG
ncbi:MAG: WYL domain-containing protein [Acidimicrobiia bacterium]|nr:WYL domain-containing protein [Acidimicrobiia bacterium]MBP8179561.1 WYL domain-containing protein [Acidimicrobiia bacterium]